VGRGGENGKRKNCGGRKNVGTTNLKSKEKILGHIGTKLMIKYLNKLISILYC
jgi:hypothetical protein